MANKHMKRLKMALLIIKMQIRSRGRCNKSIKMAKNLRLIIPSFGEVVEKTDSHTVMGM